MKLLRTLIAVLRQRKAQGGEIVSRPSNDGEVMVQLSSGGPVCCHDMNCKHRYPEE